MKFHKLTESVNWSDLYSSENEDEVFSSVENIYDKLLNSHPYNSICMKVPKKIYLQLLQEWATDLYESHTVDAIIYNKEFYLDKLYKRKYSPLLH